MTSQPYGPWTDLRGCFVARFVPLESITNPDVDGIIVGVTFVVVTLCLRIQMHWSRASIDVLVMAYLAQLYSVLLSTLLSINHQQLSLFDANYALMLSSSPLTTWLVFASICDLLGSKTDFFGRIQSHHRIVRTLGALLLPLWFGLNFTLSLSTWAFKDSELCNDSIIKDLWLYPSPVPFLMLIFSSFLGFSILCIPPAPLATRLLLFLALLLTCITTIFFLWTFFLFFTLPFLSPLVPPLPCAMCLFLVARYCTMLFDSLATPGDTISESNGNVLLFGVSVLHDFYWAYTVIFSAFIAPGSGYVVSYSQLVPLLATVPPLLSTFKLGYARRWDLFHFVRCPLERVWCATLSAMTPTPAPASPSTSV